MNLYYVILFSILFFTFLFLFWIIYRGWKTETISFLRKIDNYTNLLESNRHRIIENARLNGFPVGQVIYLKTIDDINVFFHFGSDQFIPDFLPNEELMEDSKESTQLFLKSKRPPCSFEETIELIGQYYDMFPDSEAHLYKGDFFNRLPYLLPS